MSGILQRKRAPAMGARKAAPPRVPAKKRQGGAVFRCVVLSLIFAVVALSVLTLVLSLVVIQKEKSLNDGRVGGANIPQITTRRKEKEIRKENFRTHKKTSKINEVQVPETARTIQAEPLKPNGSEGNLAGTKPLEQGKTEVKVAQRNGRRLLTYKRFGGRLNNQLFQFITALQHARVLKRTLVVPNEVRTVDWTGMFDGFGIWDLKSLNNEYDIDWVTGLSAEFVNTMPENCVLKPKEGEQLLNGGQKLWDEWDEKCPDVLNLAGNTGLLFCGQQHQFCGDSEAQLEAYRIYEHIRLAPSLLRHIPSKREEFKGGGYDEMAIHSRRAGEGGYDWKFCIGGNSRTCRGHTAVSDRNKFCDVRTMKGNCAIWLDLEYQIKSKNALKDDQKQYKFVLASDGTHDWSIDFKGQFVVANNTDWLVDLEKRVHDDADPKKLVDAMAVSAFARAELKGHNELSRMRNHIDALTATLLDMFSLVDSRYLLGAYYSTLSLNACLLRGMKRMYDSNMCWMLMHPTSKHAISPPPEESVNVNKNAKEDDPLPPALMSEVEHAFVRSDDGNFIAIDRFLIRHKGKTVIGVLGDGLVPMTSVKNKKGEEVAQADFTCSYGDVHDSPATVVLMKGNQPFTEHYYVRGEKHNTPFSTNGDRFRTMIILCKKLFFDRGLSRHPPLVLKSRDNKFSLSIGSSFQRPVEPVLKKNSENIKEALVHCLTPAYGLKDPRWIIEYLEYHRAIGVAHVHVYNVDMHSPDIQSALQAFRDEGFITRHDWSEKASGGYTTHKTYEHAKWAAQTDCYLRSRGMYDYALFSDIDEIAVGGNSASGHIGPALEMCEAAKKKEGKIACSFNSNTVSSVYTKLNDKEESAMKDKLILERYDGVEAKPHCPSNCKCMGNHCSQMMRKFHYGRQKYIVNVRDLNIPPRPMWTHALARDYEEMDKIMKVLPDDVMHVRHYQGHWYKNGNLLDTMDEKDAPLPASVMNSVRSSIEHSKDKRHKLTKKLIYAKARDTAVSDGIEWIKTVERPMKYHKKKMD